MNSPVDTLIFAAWIVPVIPRDSTLENHAIALRNGRIEAILPATEAAGLKAAETLELPNHVLIPGLINMHGHAAMSLLRGYADDYPLRPWLEDCIWPVEGRHMSPEFVRDGTDLAIAEMLRSGTTCFSDMYFFPNVTAERASQAGIRCQITFPVFDFPTAWGTDADDYIHKGLTLRDDLKHSELVSVVFGPHAPYTVNDTALAKIATLADELDLPIHIHLHETRDEVEECERATTLRPLAKLNQLGLIGPRTQCVHMTALNREEIDLLAAVGAHVIHCPDSNMKLGSGACPVDALRRAGINVALGTDGAASNNDLSMLGEMRSAALLAKLSSGDATHLPAQQVLEMATLAGARAMGREDELGSLEVGKMADLVAVDLSPVETQPVYQPLSQLVYAAQASQVSHAWIAGQQVLRERRLCTLDEADISERARDWAATIGKHPR